MQLQFQPLLRFHVELLSDANIQSESSSASSQLSCLLLDPQAPHLYLGDTIGNLYCYDVGSGKKLSVLQWHQQPIAAISRYQNCLYSFDRSQNLAAWDLSTLQVIQTYPLAQIQELSDQSYGYDLHESFEKIYGARDASGFSTSKTARFTDDGRYLFFCVDCSHGVNPNIYTIDVTTGSLVRAFNWEDFYRSEDDDFCTIDAIAISRDGQQLAASGCITFYAVYYTEGFSYPDWTHSRELVHQWLIEDGVEVCCYEYNDYMSGPCAHERIDLAFSPEIHQLLVEGQDGQRLWNVPKAEGDSLIAKAEATPTETLRDRINLDDDDAQWFVAEQGVFDWSPIGSLVAFGSRSGKLKFVDISTGDRLFEQQVSNAVIQQVQFSSDGKLLALYSQDLTCEVWRII
jgi:WD40 repeat protein